MRQMTLIRSPIANFARASWAFLVLGLLLPACGAEPAGESEYSDKKIKPSVYQIIGSINKEAVDRFKEHLAKSRARSTTLIITSAGGDGRYALELGDLIKSKNVDLVIDRYCISSCAQAILPSARTVKVMNGAVVVFHWSGSDIILPSSASPRLKNELDEYIKKENEFYLNRSIDSSKMKLLRDQSVPICTIDRITKSSDSLDRYGTAYRYSGVTPSLSLINSMGIKNISGYWPKNQNDIIMDARKAGFSAKFNIKYIEKLENIDISHQNELCK